MKPMPTLPARWAATIEKQQVFSLLILTSVRIRAGNWRAVHSGCYAARPTGANTNRSRGRIEAIDIEKQGQQTAARATAQAPPTIQGRGLIVVARLCNDLRPKILRVAIRTQPTPAASPSHPARAVNARSSNYPRHRL